MNPPLALPFSNLRLDVKYKTNCVLSLFGGYNQDAAIMKRFVNIYFHKPEESAEKPLNKGDCLI